MHHFAMGERIQGMASPSYLIFWVSLAVQATPGAVHAGEAAAPWPIAVPGHVPVQAGEHPRLFFRRSDLPALRNRAESAEGKQILTRLRATLGGGEAMPTAYNQRPPVNTGAVGPTEMPLGAFTLWHSVGFGFLHQITGEARYAALARTCVEKVLAGQGDRDERYNWAMPGAINRGGPILASMAMAYDLCYDAWDPDFRSSIAREMMTYSKAPVNFGHHNDGKRGPVSFDLLAMKPNMPTQSNHIGSELGGVGLTALALRGDPGVDGATIERYLATIDRRIDASTST